MTQPIDWNIGHSHNQKDDSSSTHHHSERRRFRMTWKGEEGYIRGREWWLSFSLTLTSCLSPVSTRLRIHHSYLWSSPWDGQPCFIIEPFTDYLIHRVIPWLTHPFLNRLSPSSRVNNLSTPSTIWHSFPTRNTNVDTVRNRATVLTKIKKVQYLPDYIYTPISTARWLYDN